MVTHMSNHMQALLYYALNIFTEMLESILYIELNPTTNTMQCTGDVEHPQCTLQYVEKSTILFQTLLICEKNENNVKKSHI